MTLSKRLLITIVACGATLLILGGSGIWQLNRAQARFDFMQGTIIQGLADTSAARHALTDIRMASYRHVGSDAAQVKAAQEQLIARADADFDRIMQSNHPPSARGRALLNDDIGAMQRFRAVRDRLLTASRAGRTGEARGVLEGEFNAAAVNLNQTLDRHSADVARTAADIIAENTAAYSGALTLSLLTMALGGLISGGLAFTLYRLITRGLDAMRNTIVEVESRRDFTRRADATRHDEIGETAAAFNRLMADLQGSFRSLADGAGQVEHASRQLSQTANEVSTAAASQSEASATIAATVEELTVSIGQVAGQSRHQNEGAQAARELVGSSTRIIDQTITDINEISRVVKHSAGNIQQLAARSEDVAAVIGVIRDIADQTNLLALNAAIEAARAGEQGRGFAVVADEVRKLAERTSQSTQEISVTIETMLGDAREASSQMKSAESLAETGVSRTDEASRAIHRIGENATDAARASGEIALVIQQQGAASTTLAEMVEHTARAAEQASTWARDTAHSADELDRLARTQAQTLAQYQV
jgi:methyl-accepting chemotaxis protein